ncbi:MAG: hypothetical protein AAGG48_20100 [Planctomycetota bacterium]
MNSENKTNVHFRGFLSRRRGQALVEFGVIAFVLSAMVAGLLGILVLALGSFQNNIAAESVGRELDGNQVLIEENFRTYFESDVDDPFPMDSDFEDITAKQVYRFLNEYPIDVNGRVLYDESLLILSPDSYFNDRDSFPSINRMLLGQYVFDPDVVPDGGSEQGAYRFPGAVVRNERTGNQTVLVPLLPGGGAEGIGRSINVYTEEPEFFYPVALNWVAPLVVGKLQDGDGFEFQVILFHPSQPASTIRIQRVVDGQGDIVSQTPVVADDQAVIDDVSGIVSLPGDPGDGSADYAFATPGRNSQFSASPSRGQFGLGESFAFTTTVRPFRLVFETASLFRIGASLNPIAVKYEYADDGDPGPEITDVSELGGSVDDQSLVFEQRVIDRSTETLRRYIVDSAATNDFDSNYVRLLPNDDGIWRITVSVELQRDVPDPDATEDHRFELRLYKNGVYERLITQIDEPMDSLTRVLEGNVLSPCLAEDVLQVRVFSERPAGETYEVSLSGESETNWVLFERLRD